MPKDPGLLILLLLCAAVVGVWTRPLWMRALKRLTRTEATGGFVPSAELLRGLREKGGHPASGRFCLWCGKDTDKEPCDPNVTHHSIGVPTYCHICGAHTDEPCDSGLHS